LKKGAKVYVEGQLQTRKWQGQDGQDRYSTEVVLQGFNAVLTMLDSRGSGAGAGAPLPENDQGYASSGALPSNGTAKRTAAADAKGTFDNTLNDDIPF
jgi:single-strand DNA-binding protein